MRRVHVAAVRNIKGVVGWGRLLVINGYYSGGDLIGCSIDIFYSCSKMVLVGLTRKQIYGKSKQSTTQ